MPINTNHWNDYLLTITNHKNRLAQQMISAYNQTFQQFGHQHQLGLAHINTVAYQNLKGDLSELLAKRTKAIVSQWDKVFKPTQLIEWNDITKPLLLFMGIPDAIAEEYCMHCNLLEDADFMYYQKLTTQQAEQDKKISSAQKAFFDCLIYLNNRFLLILKKSRCH